MAATIVPATARSALRRRREQAFCMQCMQRRLVPGLHRQAAAGPHCEARHCQWAQRLCISRLLERPWQGAASNQPLSVANLGIKCPGPSMLRDATAALNGSSFQHHWLVTRLSTCTHQQLQQGLNPLHLVGSGEVAGQFEQGTSQQGLTNLQVGGMFSKSECVAATAELKGAVSTRPASAWIDTEGGSNCSMIQVLQPARCCNLPERLCTWSPARTAVTASATQEPPTVALGASTSFCCT